MAGFAVAICRSKKSLFASYMKPIFNFGQQCAALAVFLLTVVPCTNAQQRSIMDVIRQDRGACDPTSQDCAPNSAGAGILGQCAPGDPGAVCNMQQPAAEGDRANLNTGAGNPINIITGNKYQYEVDMPALPGVLGLELVRHYNSAISKPTDANGMIGRGWRLSYETDLFVRGDSIHIMQADGSRLIFNRDPDNPDTCANEDPARGKITIRQTPQGPDYTWTWSNGRKLNFNAQGRLVQILAPTGEFVTLQRAPNGNLLKVTDPQGRSLQLRYLEAASAQANDRYKGVVAIDTPVGEYRYEYGSERPKGSDIDPDRLIATLVRVHLPASYDHDTKRSPHSDYGTTVSTVTRHYHHEDPKHPTLLTGISVIGTGSDGKFMNERISTYAYNVDGKAVMSVRGEPLRHDDEGKPVEGTGIEQVTFDRSEPGKTRLTNSLGQVTVYKHGSVGGIYRIFEVFGPGCVSCGETNVRYRYDRLGRLTGRIKLDHNGLPVSGLMTEYDAWGRKTRISRVSYRNGKPGRAEWMERYEYAVPDEDAVPSQLPVLIARPSVVIGREHQIRSAFNPFGQQLWVTESGWAPAAEVDGGMPVPLSRTTKYGYSTLNGRSVLSSIDGPLENGESNSPVDSDITLIRYDQEGNFPTTVVAPGNRTVAVTKRDLSGYPVITARGDGVNPLLSIRTTFSPRGQPTEIARNIRSAGQDEHIGPLPALWNWITGSERKQFHNAQRSIRIEHDAAYRPIRIIREDETQLEATYDRGGRLASLADQDGNRQGRTLNAESQVLEAFLQSAMPGLPLDIRTSLRYDNHNRLRDTYGPHGLTTTYSYNQAEEGKAEILDPLQRRTSYRSDPLSRVI